MKKTILTGLFLSLFLTFATFTSIAGGLYEPYELSIAMAASEGNLTEVQRLIAGVADENIKNKYTLTAIVWAISYSQMTVTRSLVNSSNVNTVDEDGHTLLMAAIDRSKWEVVTFLVDKGAWVNAKTTTGKTAFMHAASGRNLASIQYLVDKNAHINARNNDGWTALGE